jgi:prepilin-type N-terminal cleavage/methylation domain-containing protein
VVRRAFSLVEVMVACAVFGAGLAAVFTVFNTASSLFEHQRHTTYAIHLSEAWIEELLMRPSADTELTPGPLHGPAWYDRNGFANPACPDIVVGPPVSTPTCRYRVTWRTAPSVVPGVRHLTVTTHWLERGRLLSTIFTTQRN